MKNKVLILYECSPNDWTLRAWRDNGLTAEIQFKKVGKLLRAVRRFWIKAGLPFQQLWYRDWKQQVLEAEVVIVHISALNMRLPKDINAINPSARVIAWYWNIVDETTSPSKIQGNCELWSFDRGDCLQYKMQFNHQYYFKSLAIIENNNKWDIYFVGNDKGRSKVIVPLWFAMKKLGINALFQIVNPIDKEIPEEIITPYLDYQSIRENISHSCAVLEIVKPGQTGPTLRAMEALFFGKKLITNNPSIKQEPFYDPQNIFVLGERPNNAIQVFLESPMLPYDQETIDQYDVANWLSAFFPDEKGIQR